MLIRSLEGSDHNFIVAELLKSGYQFWKSDRLWNSLRHPT